MKVLAGLAITVAAVVALGCGGAQRQGGAPEDPGSSSATVAIDASCDDVVAHVKELSINASGATTEEQKDQTARDVEPALIDLAEECEAGWSPTYRHCVVNAKSRDDVAICDKANTSGSEP